MRDIDARDRGVEGGQRAGHIDDAEIPPAVPPVEPAGFASSSAVSAAILAKAALNSGIQFFCAEKPCPTFGSMTISPLCTLLT